MNSPFGLTAEVGAPLTPCALTIISLALGTGLRLAEIVGLDVGDVFAPDGTPRLRRIRAALGLVV